MKRVLLALLIATAAHAARITPADRYKLVNASDPQIAPDGKSIVCVVARANVKDNRWDSDLVLIDVDSGAQRALTFERRGIASPRWSPDGAQIAFLANASNDTRREAPVVASLHARRRSAKDHRCTARRAAVRLEPRRIADGLRHRGRAGAERRQEQSIV